MAASNKNPKSNWLNPSCRCQLSSRTSEPISIGRAPELTSPGASAASTHGSLASHLPRSVRVILMLSIRMAAASYQLTVKRECPKRSVTSGSWLRRLIQSILDAPHWPKLGRMCAPEPSLGRRLGLPVSPPGPCLHAEADQPPLQACELGGKETV